jgi:hypothetical protein
VTRPAAVLALLDRADAARAAGRGGEAARLYDEAAVICRADDDLDGWTRALLGAASVYVFGSDPGKLPAQLYDVLARTTDDATRARLGAALTRCWAYAGHTRRAVQFADEAVQRARAAGSPELIADCLDAALAAHWGPDELVLRRSLAAELDDIAAHVLDPDARLRAHLWGLTVACESLDLQGMHREMRALEVLGEESPRAQFFAASRRHTLDLLRGRFDTSARLTEVATGAAAKASLADSWMVLKSMTTYAAALSGDTETCSSMAAECEDFALAEGQTTLCAEAAFMWACAGNVDRVRLLVNTFHGPALGALARDVNWLLTLQCVLEAAIFAGDLSVVRDAADLLAPYEDRAVVNAGAVMFHGVTDDTLARAAALLGDAATYERLRARALATYERIGAQWWRDRLARWKPPASPNEPVDARQRMHLHPAPGGLWLVGPEDSVAQLTGLRGFAYLRELLRRPSQPVAALDLVGAGTGVADESSLGEVLDQQALRAYRRRLSVLDEELAEAEQWSDLGRIENIGAERDALLAELSRATGLSGRVRTTGSSAERARIAAKKALSAAIARIATVDESLAGHLRARVHTGLSCSYEPLPGDAVEWVLD